MAAQIGAVALERRRSYHVDEQKQTVIQPGK